jgi:hypothetical protein
LSSVDEGRPFWGQFVSSLRDSVVLFLYPGLTSWAKMFRPSGAGALFSYPGLEPALSEAEGFWVRDSTFPGPGVTSPSTGSHYFSVRIKPFGGRSATMNFLGRPAASATASAAR